MGQNFDGPACFAAGNKNKERGSLFTFLPDHCESDRQGNHMRRRIIKRVRSEGSAALPGSPSHSLLGAEDLFGWIIDVV